jgi:hypothetical protein
MNLNEKEEIRKFFPHDFIFLLYCTFTLYNFETVIRIVENCRLTSREFIALYCVCVLMGYQTLPYNFHTRLHAQESFRFPCIPTRKEKKWELNVNIVKGGK